MCGRTEQRFPILSRAEIHPRAEMSRWARRCEALGKPRGSLGGALGHTRLSAGGIRRHQGVPVRPTCPIDQKILAALTSVFHTPQPSGTPTNAQNATACRSSPPLPIPCQPATMAVAFLSACSLATSSWLMNHFELTGLTRALQINPMTSIPHRIYMVEL